MTEATKNPLAISLGTYYPTHYLVAVFDDPARAGLALSAVQQAGFSEAVAELCPGAEFLRNYRDFVAHRTLFERAALLVLGEEHVALEEYLAEAERGASFVTVHALERMDRDRAQEVLHAHGGHAMRYYGTHTITDLP